MRRGVAHRAVGRGWLWVLLLLAALAPASAAPARLRVTVTRDGVAETQVVERTLSRDRERGMRGEKLSLSGNGWSLQGVVAGSTGDPTERLDPRGTFFFYEARLGLAVGFVNGSAAPLDVELEVCIDPLPIGGTAVYGGSIAGSVLDADGDGTGSVRTNSDPDPIYELRLDTALCDAVNGTRTTIDTLYDAPKTSSVPGIYQGATIAEEFFGSPIPARPAPPRRPRSRWWSDSSSLRASSPVSRRWEWSRVRASSGSSSVGVVSSRVRAADAAAGDARPAHAVALDRPGLQPRPRGGRQDRIRSAAGADADAHAGRDSVQQEHHDRR